jgi:hypothetical protein
LSSLGILIVADHQLSYERVRQGLEELQMSTALEALDNTLEAVRVEELPPIELVNRLLDIELKAAMTGGYRPISNLPGCPIIKNSLTAYSTVSEHRFRDHER